MTIRVFAWFTVCGVLLAAGPGHASAVRPLERSVLDQAPPTAALFHPGNEASLAVLDNLRDGGADTVLAVCVGAGCSAEAARQTARDHDWSFELAYDPSGEAAEELLGTRSVPGMVRIGGMPGSAPRATGAMAGTGQLGAPARRGMAASMATPAVPTGPSTSKLVFLSIPIALLGLGIGVLYVGSRRRPYSIEDDADEDDLLAHHVRQRHGRKHLHRPRR